MFIRSVKDVVAGREVPSVQSGATVRQACHVLDHFNVGAVLVLKGEALVGLVSERDVIRKCIGQDRHSDSTLVDEIMTVDPKTVQASDGLNDALAHMTQGHFRHMPVLEAGRCIGLLSIRDVPTEYRMMYERFLEMRQKA
ncbi:MAG: cbs [uncultured bacterium]|uniref:CBS domain-containing protein n=1 Tax=Cypionkella sp. TaxID=2811411 RepID=UPI0002856E77|nr:CBS domain-containing protein [Cypionkella sp.]EKD60005.1 MAG: cbs [uncultured bacterium]KAF0172413.1 MAG: putative signal transduction protein [Paracoccaceae bacterium]MDO8327575.1 CBS domain-containing protein [Cypionkella sp.]